MKKLMILVTTTLLILGVVETTKADDNFTNHVDLYQIAIGNDGRVNFLDIGYHFTLLRVNRFQFLGAGAGLNLYTKKDSGWDCGCEFSPFLTIPMISVKLTNQIKNEGLNFGTNWIYDTKTKNGSMAFGFSFSWK